MSRFRNDRIGTDENANENFAEREGLKYPAAVGEKSSSWAKAKVTRQDHIDDGRETADRGINAYVQSQQSNFESVAQTLLECGVAERG